MFCVRAAMTGRPSTLTCTATPRSSAPFKVILPASLFLLQSHLSS